MPDLAPWPAVRYGPEAGDPGRLLAPPYDVIDAEEARELRAGSPFNAVRLVLPEGGVPGCYDLAARRLRDWLDDGILIRDERPSLYVYGQTFRRDDATLTRHGVFGALRLSAFSGDEVLPHEETHRGPKEDRLALMRACRAQLSPVFLLSRDPSRRLPALLDRAVQGAPVLEARTPDGVEHRLWRALEGPLARELREVVASGPLLVADGHHRYETALELARGTPEGHPGRRTLACVVGRGDAGLLCLPTHRSLSRPPAEPEGRQAAGDATDGAADAGAGPDASAWPELLADAFDVDAMEPPDPEAAARAAGEAGEGAMVLGPGGNRRRAFLVRHRPDGAAAADDPGENPSPVVFDRLVLRRLYGTDADSAVERGLLAYHRDAGEAVATAGERGAAFLLPPPDVDAVWERARRGRRMPPKSTYFWPKLPSGLLFRLLDGDR